MSLRWSHRRLRWSTRHNRPLQIRNEALNEDDPVRKVRAAHRAVRECGDVHGVATRGDDTCPKPTQEVCPYVVI